VTLSIEHLSSGYDVAPLVDQLARNPDVWDRYTLRTKGYEATPHKSVSDIWVRFRAWSEFDGDAAKFANTAHESVWYPVIHQIPTAWSLARRVVRDVGGGKLGGVLITRVPAGGEVKPHVDQGWHAGHYEKFAVQVKGNAKQAFCFEDRKLSAMPGDLYTFDNSRCHWVTNGSDEERITLIICVRRHEH